MTERDNRVGRARNLLDERFGIGLLDAHRILDTDAGARRIYECAVDVIAGQLQQWQPIETAPKDGTWVLICGGQPGYGWDAEDDFVPPAVVAKFMTNTTPQCWQFAWYDSGYYGEWDEPTHWMPVPEPAENGD